jgi:hypothetical protein
MLDDMQMLKALTEVDLAYGKSKLAVLDEALQQLLPGNSLSISTIRRARYSKK